MAVRTAATTSLPLPSSAAIALDSVHPVPWVLEVWNRRPSSHVRPAGSARTSGLSSSGRWPPLTSTARAPRALSASACSAIVWRSRASGSPRRAAASGRFGVTTMASGRRRSRSAATACSARSEAPPLAIITGSSTIGTPGCRDRMSATVSAISAFAIMPIFTASTRTSSKTAWI